jgi:hypothetical protein
MAPGRGGRIRTCDNQLPKLMRYQTALRPVGISVSPECHTTSVTPFGGGVCEQALPRSGHVSPGYPDVRTYHALFGIVEWVCP